MAELDLEAIKARRARHKYLSSFRDILRELEQDNDALLAEVERLRAEREGRDLDPGGIEPLLDDMLTREFGFTYEYRAVNVAPDGIEQEWPWDTLQYARSVWSDYADAPGGTWVERRLVGPPERIEGDDAD